ncbi:hypothetical protein PP636_gp40 [Arthrobacter phage Hestia]|uniref:Uncharacterized protein n=1 Tax=Arthrobacter phage Hestia TaxID=2419609 RepID=A0A3G3M3E5_9CAUD|nr:hypothetical protein PP636_gp40 [Arthrobacter phage Hestia]AYR00933.1 hypothetical protein PBI_HESTIA_55 [Arthrobacter phage Hestia]
MSIPDEAVEAAAEELKRHVGVKDIYAARDILEAAAPHLMAQAWDAGHERGFWNGRLSELTVPYDAPDPLIGKQDAEANNPYRSQP